MRELVTVCIPTTARPHYLRTAVETVENQLGREAIGEVVVSENKSDRRSEALVRQFAELPIRYLYREPTLPMLPHLFSTFRQAKTPYVAILNDDDWWFSSHLADGLKSLTDHPQAVAYASASMFVQDEIHRNPLWIDRSAAVWLLAGKPSWLKSWVLEPRRMLALCWVYTPFHWSSLIARTDQLSAVLDELEDKTYYTHTIDRLVFARLSLRGAFCYNPVPDTFVRWHSSNWIKSRPAKEVQAVVRATVDLVDQMAREKGWDLRETWKQTLAAMPLETELDVLDRLYQAFLPREVRQLGFADYFHRRPPNNRLVALRKIAGNMKRLVLGTP